MTKFWALLLVVLAVFSAGPAEAAIFLSGARVVVPRGQVLREDAYVLGAQVEVDGTVAGDLVVLGGAVTVRGRVEGDLSCAGGRVSVEGPVGQSARLAGAEVRLASPVGEDLLVAAGGVTTAAGTRVGRETAVRAGQAVLAGELGTRLQAVAGDLRLLGTVSGPAVLEAPKLLVTERARVEGPLHVRTAQLNPIAPGARILGGVSATLIEPAGFWSQALAWGLRVGMALVAGLVLLWLWPHTAVAVGRVAREAPWLRVLLGLGVLIGVPFVAIMAMLTVLGLPLGLMVLALYAATLYLAQLATAWAAGQWAFERSVGLDGYWKRALAFALGLVVVYGLKAVPVAGPYFTMVFVFWGLGAIATAGFRAYRREHPPGPEVG